MRYRTGPATAVVLMASMFAASCATSRSAATGASVARNDDCVFSSTLTDYQPLDNDRLILWAPGRSQAYLLKLTIPSNDLRWGIQVGFEDGDRNGMICGYGLDAVLIPGGLPRRITIGSMSKITKDEAQSLLAAVQKKVDKPPAPETAK